jgi:hypothetical protein
MPKRKCTFKPEWLNEWRFIKKGRHNEVECSVCNSFISIRHGGRADIKDRLKCQKHALKVSTVSSCSSAKLTSYFIKPQTEDENKVIVAELTQAYHTIRHHQSFRTADCTNKSMKVL